MRDSVSQCVGFFEKAVPKPSAKNLTTQLGCHFEEVVEHMQELNAMDPSADFLLMRAIQATHALAEHLKAHGGVEILAGARVNYIDALCDQMVTAIGCAHMADMNIRHAFDEVNRSNLSKFGDDGKPIFDQNMKVTKGPNYLAAELSPYV